jgi:hypothetical protein
VIENYFREIARLLRPGALFKVQVQGLPRIAQPESQPEPAAPAEPVPAREPEPAAPAEPVASRQPEPAPPAGLPWLWRLTGRIPLPIRKRFLRPIRRWMLSIPPATACPPPPEPEPEAAPAPPPPPAESYFAEPDTWVGIMFTPDYAQAVCDNSGFELRHQRGEGGPEYWLWCFKK